MMHAVAPAPVLVLQQITCENECSMMCCHSLMALLAAMSCQHRLACMPRLALRRQAAGCRQSCPLALGLALALLAACNAHRKTGGFKI